MVYPFVSNKKAPQCTLPTSSYRKLDYNHLGTDIFSILRVSSGPIPSDPDPLPGTLKTATWVAVLNKKIRHIGRIFISSPGVIRSGNLRPRSGANVNVADTALLIGEVQSNVPIT